MKILLLLCGIQNSGKSTFVKNNNLTEYTICPDTIRTMLCGTHFDENGDYGIAYTNQQEKAVWRIVKEMVQKRLEKGLFTVLDCMNLSSKNIRPFIQIAKDTHSRVFMVDMMQNVDLKTCLDRNEKREFNKIPSDVIVNAYSQYQQLKLPSGIPVLNPDHWKETVYRRFVNLEDQGFEHVAVFGDLHGCYDELQCLLNTLPENTLKVFAGDYCDRGYNNVGVIQWILDHKDDQDKIFLEGNHEKHLLAYGKDIKSSSPVFEKITRKQFDDAHISKKELRVFYHKLRDMFYFKIGSKTILVTHGGISKIGENLVFTSSHDLIHGTGDYKDLDLVVDSWNRDCNGVYQVHGHRNIQDYPICESYFSFNLEGKVEQGGNLRMILFHADDTYQTFECKNTHQSFNLNTFNIQQFVEDCKNSKHIKIKEFEHTNVKSFNFTQSAFYHSIWNDLTEKARGLYINTNTNKIVARGFDKFFNIGERPCTDVESLANTLQYPVDVYYKENGFLGLVGYDSEMDELIITSKSDLQGTSAQLVRDHLLNKIGEQGLQQIKNYVAQNNCSLALEVCDIVNDPHIIEYPESNVYLLSIIDNTLDFKQKPYAEIVAFAQSVGLDYKKYYGQIHNAHEWLAFFQQDFGEIEGFVFEDAHQYMVKYKTPYYNFWKHKRSIIGLGRLTRNVQDLDREFYTFYLSNPDFKNMDIITLRKIFLKNKPPV